MLADEAVQRGGDPGLNAVILVVAIVTSLVVMCCAYYTVRFMKVKVKSVALSKQVTPTDPGWSMREPNSRNVSLSARE